MGFSSSEKWLSDVQSNPVNWRNKKPTYAPQEPFRGPSSGKTDSFNHLGNVSPCAAGAVTAFVLSAAQRMRQDAPVDHWVYHYPWIELSKHLLIRVYTHVFILCIYTYHHTHHTYISYMFERSGKWFSICFIIPRVSRGSSLGWRIIFPNSNIQREGVSRNKCTYI